MAQTVRIEALRHEMVSNFENLLTLNTKYPPTTFRQCLLLLLHRPHLLYLALDPSIPSHPASMHCPWTQMLVESGLHLLKKESRPIL